MIDYETSDPEIRSHLNKRLSRENDRASTILVEELGLDHGRTRIDIAVLNSSLHGFEIKSSRDTLRRLPYQLSVYSAVLEMLTLVVAPDHLEAIDRMLPSWCGVMVAERRRPGTLSFRQVRESSQNPNPDPFRIAHLLWKSEALSLLVKYDAAGISPRSNRTQLYESIAEHVPTSDLVSYIRQCFVARENWRDHGERKKSDD